MKVCIIKNNGETTYYQVADQVVAKLVHVQDVNHIVDAIKHNGMYIGDRERDCQVYINIDNPKEDVALNMFFEDVVQVAGNYRRVIINY